MIRVSIGTAAALGLKILRTDAPATTAYLMTYTEGSCTANCQFCSQARESPGDRSQLSRVMWPEYPTGEVMEAFRRHGAASLQRICIQAINYSRFMEDVLGILGALREASPLPVSVDTCPVSLGDLRRLREAGADAVGIPLDAATPTLFEAVKGRAVRSPYRWESHLATIEEAQRVFGAGKVMTNLIVGLGESEREAAELIQRLRDRGVPVALFAFTPVRGTPLASRPAPSLAQYRRVQLARHLMTRGETRFERMAFTPDGRIKGFGVDASIWGLVADGEAFRTTGCPGCNRPYYNERPRGPIYNYPRPLTPGEADEEARMMEEYLR